MKYRLGLVLLLLMVVLPTVLAQNSAREDGEAPEMIGGAYSTTYYARFDDWSIFSVLLPMRSAAVNLPYDQRFDFNPEGQIRGRLRGEVAEGSYTIELPTEPTESAWFDTDGNPATPSEVKVFVAGIATGLIEERYVSKYDFMYARSFFFDPNTQLWQGQLIVWSASEDAVFPALNGEDRRYYTADDVVVKVPQGWSVVEVKAKAGKQSLRVYRTTQPDITLLEPPQFQDVDLTQLSYEDAYFTLLDELERTYVFTDYRGVDWEALRQEFAPQAARVNDPQAFQTLLQDTLFTFYDGHLSIYGAGLPNWVYGTLGMRAYPVNGELMVVDVYDHSPVGEESNIIPGTVILSLNDEDAMHLFETLPLAVSRGGHKTGELWIRGDYVFRAEPGTRFELTYRLPNGDIERVRLRTASLSDVYDNVSLDDPQGVVYHGFLPSGVGVIGIRDFTSGYVDDLWDVAMRDMVARAAPGIIIDLRENGGGFSSLSNYMLGDLLDEDVYSGREVSSLDEDGDGALDIEEEYYFGRERRFDPQNIVVLIGPECFSACEFAASAFQDVGATVMGYLTSGGAGGGVGATYYLPGSTAVYGMAVVRSEDAEGNHIIEGVGVPLDVQVPFTAEGLASGEDVLIGVAEAFLLGQ